MSAEAQAARETNQVDAETNNHEATIAAFDAIIQKHSDTSDPKATADVARALVSKAIVLSRLGRGSEELAVYDEVVRRFTMSSQAEIVALVAMAQNRRGRALAMAGRVDEALMAFDLAWALATGWKDPHLERQAASALYATGALRKRQGRTADALTAWGDMVRQYGASEDIEVAAKLVAADEARVALLRQSERINDAVRVCNDLVGRVGARTESGFRAAIGFAWFTRVDCLLAMGNPKGALEACDEAAELADDDANVEGDPRLARWRAGIAVLRGRALRELGQINAAVLAFSAVDRDYRKESSPEVAEQVAMALVELADVLSAQAEFAKARAFLECVIRRYADRESRSLDKLVARARKRLGKLPIAADATATDVHKTWPDAPVEAADRMDRDFEMLRGNSTFNAYMDEARSA